MAKSSTGRGADQFVVRMPPGMREKIAEAAENNGRSMNAEIISRLEQSFEEFPSREQYRMMYADLMKDIAGLQATILKLHGELQIDEPSEEREVVGPDPEEPR